MCNGLLKDGLLFLSRLLAGVISNVIVYIACQCVTSIGINVNTLHTWISKYSRPKENDKAIRTDEHLYDELKRLKKEVARLTEERDLLKKAAAYFAKEQR
jgi:transposase